MGYSDPATKTQTLLAALVAASLNLTIAYAQNNDPYLASKNAGPPVAVTASAKIQAPAETVNLSICYEDFPVSLEMAAAL